MEIELKYSIPCPEIAEQIWADKLFFHMEEDDSREELCFDAKYYDTPDHILSGNELAYRIRKEGSAWVASVKTKGHTEGALHVREEVNVSVSDRQPDIKVFHGSDIGKGLIKLVGDKELTCIMDMRYRRRRFRIDTGEGIYELSIDDGWIIVPSGQKQILEVEIELFSGNENELQELGNSLLEKYGLSKEPLSKYARGLSLLNE